MYDVKDRNIIKGAITHTSHMGNVLSLSGTSANVLKKFHSKPVYAEEQSADLGTHCNGSTQ